MNSWMFCARDAICLEGKADFAVFERQSMTLTSEN
jgi:hypothetical protein